MCRSSSSLSPLVRGVVLSSLKFTRTPQATRRVYSVGLEPAAMNVAGSAVARVREHCAPAGGTAPPQFQQLDCRTSNTGAEAPSSVCQRRAESPSPGGGSGGEPLPQHCCSCGATAAHCWSRRADKLPVATSSREACGPQAAPAAAAVPPSEHEQQRECACPAARKLARANEQACLPTAARCSARRFLKYEIFLAGAWNFQTVCFISL